MHINDTMTVISPKSSEGHIWIKSMPVFKRLKKYEIWKNHVQMKGHSHKEAIIFSRKRYIQIILLENRKMHFTRHLFGIF